MISSQELIVSVVINFARHSRKKISTELLVYGGQPFHTKYTDHECNFLRGCQNKMLKVTLFLLPLP